MVDVIIPLYNHAGSVDRAIASVLRQTYQNWMLIVVDDGSTDGWQLRREDPRIRVVRQDNRGPGSARNAGTRSGSADLIAFLDADDEWEPDFLAEMIALMSTHLDVAAACCGWTGPRESTSRTTSAPEAIWLWSPELRPAQFKERVDLMHTSATIIRRSVFEHLGGFYEDGTYGEDSYLWTAVAFTRPVVRTSKRLLRFHTDHSSLSVGRVGAYPLLPLLTAPQRMQQNLSTIDRRSVRRYTMFCARFAFVRSMRQGAPGQVARFLGSRRPRHLGWRPWHTVLVVAASIGDLVVAAAGVPLRGVRQEGR